MALGLKKLALLVVSLAATVYLNAAETALVRARWSEFVTTDKVERVMANAHVTTKPLGDAQHLPICCHNPSGPVANAATLAFAASTPLYFYHETMSQDVAWRREVCNEDVKIEDGYMYINDRPGLGVDIDEKECAKHPFRPTYIRHYVGTLTQIRPDDAVSYYS